MKEFFNYYIPSNKPGTSPLANKVFMRSRKPDSNTFDSSSMNVIFSFLHPDLLNTALRSSSKSSLVYLLCT
jgi:hypothetical protein